MLSIFWKPYFEEDRIFSFNKFIKKILNILLLKYISRIRQSRWGLHSLSPFLIYNLLRYHSWLKDTLFPQSNFAFEECKLVTCKQSDQERKYELQSERQCAAENWEIHHHQTSEAFILIAQQHNSLTFTNKSHFPSCACCSIAYQEVTMNSLVVGDLIFFPFIC